MSDHDELVDLRHRRDEDEFTIEKLKNALAQAQAQASLAASRAQALEEAAKLTEGFKHYYSTLDSQGMTSVRENVYANTVTIARKIRALITPSDSTALAKLLAEERLAELNLIPQSEHWSTGLEGYMARRKDTLMDIVAARVAELKGKKGVKS